MRSSRRSIWLLPTFAVAALASAEVGAASATSDGARAIEQTYAAYLSRAVVDKGIVSVAPEGDSYLVTWDLQKAIDLAKPTPGAVKIDKLTYRLTPGAGGDWTLNGAHFPRIAFKGRTDKGQASGALDFSGVRMDGLYDPHADEFLRSTLSIESLQGAFAIEESGQRSDFKIDEDGVTLEARAKPAADGAGVDVALAQAFKGMHESISAPASGADGDPVQMNYTFADVMGGAALKGLRAREIGDLWRYVVAHVDEAAVPAELNSRIRAALPLWSDINAHAEVHDLEFDMPEGNGTLKTLGETLRVTGLTSHGAAEVGVEIEDLELKSDLAPSWLSAVWPASLSVNLSASSDGWDKIAQAALNDPHFGDKGDLAPETETKIQEILLSGHPKLVLAPGYLKTPTINLTFEGEASQDSGAPAGHFKLSADSLDKTIEMLVEISKTEPDAQTALLITTFVKGLAKSGDDGRLMWDVDVDGSGAVTVNGSPLPTSP